MEKMIFFGGSASFAVPALRALAKNFDIALVITNPERAVGRKQESSVSFVEQAAKKLGLEVLNIEKFNDEIINKIKRANPLFFVIVDYGKIIPQKMLDLPKMGAINVHPSPLPKYRGASPMQTAILNGDAETAFSIMLIDAKVDHGPILAQKKVAILPDEIYGELYKRLSDLYPDFLVDTLKKYLNGAIMPVPQDDSQATFTKFLKREDGLIDWNKPAKKIEQMTRAYNPWPGTHFLLNEKNIKIHKSRTEHILYPDKKIGELFKTANGLPAVRCGEETLILEEVQPEGKKKMIGEEFVRGYIK
jgi:methionyl-tRNA formyltransferase